MVIQVLNLDKLIKKFGDLGDLKLDSPIVEGTREVQRTARDLAPVDTGILKASISTKITDRGKTTVTGIIYTVVNYAVYQEFGTRFMPAQPFMIPAFEQHKKGIEIKVQEYIRKQLKR